MISAARRRARQSPAEPAMTEARRLPAGDDGRTRGSRAGARSARRARSVFVLMLVFFL